MAFKINFDDEHGDDPATTLQKLRYHNLDPATVASCAPPNERTGVRGCTQWANCPFRFKGNAGPQWVGVQRIYPDGHRKDRIKACFAFVRQRERHMEQGDVWRVIAYQGDPFVWRVVEAQEVDEKGNKSKYRETLKKDIIPTWPEPEDHPKLRQLLYAIEPFKQMMDEQQELMQAEALANISGENPSFWMKPQGPGGMHGARPRDMEILTRQGGEGGEADPGSGQDEPAPTGVRSPRRGG